MEVRARQPADLPPLLPVLERAHREVGYPRRASNVRTGWLADDEALGAWVAVDAGRVVGHVALHPASGACLPLWSAATGRDADGLAVVSRLLSAAPGAGSALLARAEQEAAVRGRAAVLEVDLGGGALGFYLRRGWTRVGEVEQQWGEHRVLVAVLVRDPLESWRSVRA